MVIVISQVETQNFTLLCCARVYDKCHLNVNRTRTSSVCDAIEPLEYDVTP